MVILRIKNSLLRVFKNPQGFSLIELLVVVTIMAILAAIGITAFGGLSRSAADSRRKADIDAIAKAYEKNYKWETGKYQALDVNGGDFTAKKIPTPPEAPTGSYDGLLTAETSTFTVCARLEANPANTRCTATSATCYCQSSALGGTTQGQQQGCNNFIANQSCKLRTMIADSEQITPNPPGPMFIDCPATTINCSTLTNDITGVAYYSSAQSSTRIGTMTITAGEGLVYTVSAK